jgi:hypothetical protein
MITHQMYFRMTSKAVQAFKDLLLNLHQGIYIIKKEFPIL